MELTKLTALELGAAIKRGEASVREAVQAALDAAARDKELNAFITVTGERALERAEALQAGVKDAKSPLYGVPMAIKDNICTKGVKTSCASKILGEFAPPYDAAGVDRLADAGAVSLGKLNMDEFMKPTYGTVSRYGLIAYASSLDQIGPLCKDAADCAAILDVLQGKDAKDGTSLDGRYGHLLDGLTGDVKGLKIGLPADCFGDGLDGDVRASVLAAAEVLKGRGAEVVELSFPVMEYVVPAYYIIAAAEASSNLSRFDGVKYGWRAEEYEGLADLYRRTRTQGFGSEVKRRILLGTFVLSSGYYDAYYKKALQVKAVITDAFDRAFERCDLLLTPVAPSTAPKLGESLSDPLQMYLSDVYTVSVNLAGLPGLSMPCGFDGKGLPIGAQLIGPHFGEGVLLNAAHAFQQDTDYHKRTPEGGGPA